MRASTGSARVDDLLLGLLGVYEMAFPGRVRACYVDGSYADGSGLATSDVDLTLIFGGAFHDEVERRGAETLCRHCALLSGVELDASVADEVELRAGVHPSLKLAATLVYGEEVREDAPLVSIEQWTRDRMHSSFWRVAHLFGRPLPMRYPVDFPDPGAVFYGYDRRTVRLADGGEVPSTRDLIRLVGWAATALIAQKAGRYVARKRDCHTLYRELIGGEYADLLDDIYTLCRGRWQYLIPSDPQERRTLRGICERTLAFENAFLLEYREFVMRELRGAEAEGRRLALKVLARVPLVDEEVERAVAQLGGDGPGPLTVVKS